VPTHHLSSSSSPSPSSWSSSSSSWWRVLLVCVAGVALSATAATARADDTELAVKITKMNVRAVEEYENLNFDEARKILEKALEVSAQGGLGAHPITARTHIHLGIVMLAGFKKRDAAIKQFKAALEIQPDIKLTKNLANPEVQQVFDEASTSMHPAAAAAAAAGEPAPTGDALEEKLSHKPVQSAPHGAAIAIDARTGPALDAKKLILAVRPDGATTFVKREMKEVSPGRWSAKIQANATSGDVVSYFVEAQNDAGEAVASRGSSADPFVVNLVGALPGAEGERRPDGDATDRSRFFIGLEVGSGDGWTTGKGDVNPKAVVSPAGFAPAMLGHVSPELGYFVRPDFLLSVELRFQYVTGANSRTVATGDAACGPDRICNPPKNALAGFARATWLWGAASFHPFVAAAVGAGTIRHVAEFQSIVACGDPAKPVACVDTIASGPVFGGGGVGFFYNATDNIALTVGINTLVGFPTLTLNADINGGVAFEF
jgi:hypothetical protein